MRQSLNRSTDLFFGLNDLPLEYHCTVSSSSHPARFAAASACTPFFGCGRDELIGN